MAKVSPHPQWATKFRRSGTELRCLKGKYYLYSISTSWDPIKKKQKKITGKLLGKITEKDGFIESDKQKILKKTKFTDYTISLREYAASWFVFENNQDIIERLKVYFPDNYIEIACMAFFRLMNQSPIKNMQHYFEHSYLSTTYNNAKMDSKNISTMLRDIGKSRSQAVEYMRSFSHCGEYMIMDMTNVITKSKNIEYAAKGYNNKRQYDPQVNLMMAYSTSLNEPVYYRILPGNIREVKSFELSLIESGINDVILLLDKGFYSKTNIKNLDRNKFKYILPLRRNSKLIDYTPLAEKKDLEGFFKFEDRYIWYYTKIEGNKKIVCFVDERLKVEEESDYLDRITSMPEGYSLENFKEKRKTMGTISLFTNLLEMKPSDIYVTYKTRQKIEQMIDVMKNMIESDKTYMQDNDALEGWFFVNYIALIMYFRLYKLLIKYNMLSKMSPKDLLMILSEVKKIKINDQWVISEINTKNLNLLKKIDINIT